MFTDQEAPSPSTAGWTEEVRRAYAERGIGTRLPRGGRTAIVVVDLIRGFTDPECAPGSNLDQVVSETAHLLDVARAKGSPVVFTSIAFDEADLQQLVWLRKMPALRELRQGSTWVELDPRLGHRSDEPVVVKKAASAFAGTELAVWLRDRKVESVLVCGATTSGCVRATVIDACALNYSTFVPRQCVGDRAEGPHEANLLDIDAKYADVLDVADAAELMQAQVRIP